MRPKIGVAVASVLGGLLALAAPFTVSAALLWSLTASPLSVATGAATTFTMTASNLLLGRIECVVVDVPANFSISSVGMVGSTAGDSWLVRRVGNRVIAWTTSGGDRLELLDSVTFTVSATALNAGSLAWPASAYDRADCTGTGSLLGVPPIVVVTGPAVTPSPVPTPPPTPTPPVATPTPTVTATPPPPTLVPTPAPTRTPAPTATPLPSTALAPSTVGPPGSPGLTPRPQPSSTPSPGASAPASTDGSASGGAQPSSGLQGGSSGGPGTPAGEGPAFAQPVGLRVALDEPELELGLGPLGLLSGSSTWVVPVATLGGPGLIVLLWVAAQAGGASVWIPAARRLRGEDRRATG